MKVRTKTFYLEKDMNLDEYCDWVTKLLSQEIKDGNEILHYEVSKPNGDVFEAKVVLTLGYKSVEEYQKEVSTLRRENEKLKRRNQLLKKIIKNKKGDVK